MLLVDLKRHLNSLVDAIRKKAVGASSTLLEVTVVGSPQGSVMPGVVGGDPWQGTVVFEVAIAIWQRLATQLKAAQLHRVRVYETPELFVDFFGEP